MFADFYQKTILNKPKAVLLLLFIALIGLGYFSKDFKLDDS